MFLTCIYTVSTNNDINIYKSESSRTLKCTTLTVSALNTCLIARVILECVIYKSLT
jgi:hypothetical protein